MTAANTVREQCHCSFQRLRGVTVGSGAVNRPDVGLVGELFGEVSMQVKPG